MLDPHQDSTRGIQSRGLTMKYDGGLSPGSRSRQSRMELVGIRKLDFRDLKQKKIIGLGALEK